MSNEETSHLVILKRITSIRILEKMFPRFYKDNDAIYQ